MNFNHTNGCQKCEVVGTFKKRMSFPDTNAILRTDQSFRQRSQPSHHKERSLLENLPINLVDDFIVADSLHLIDHGVQKKLLNMWMKGSTLFDSKFTKVDIRELNAKIVQANKEMPSDCHRALRQLTYMSYWKGTEFRTFLLYVGVVVLKDHLHFEAYENFLQLFCAVRICSCEKYAGFLGLAKTLFNEFVSNFELIYGSDHIVSNIHNLIHVYDDVKRFGNLNTLSAYKFENALRHIKLQVQARGAPLDQIVRRIVESTNSLKINPIDIDIPKWQPCLKYDMKQHTNSIFNAYKYIQISSNVFLSIKKPGDRFFLTKKKQIVEMKYAFKLNGEYFVCGDVFLNETSFFSNPFDSKYIDMYMTQDEKRGSLYFNINQIECKLQCLSYKDSFVFMPILHSLDELNK